MTSPGTPSFSQDDLDAAIAVLLQTDDEEVEELFSLSDEELLAVDGIQNPQLTELPWVQANADAPELRELVAAVAMRSLLARGLVTTSADEDPAAYGPGSRRPLSFDAVPELRGVAVLRRIPEAFVLLHRRTAAGDATSYFYLFEVQGRRRVLWEAYDASGMHVFHRVPSTLFARQVRSFMDPESGTGENDGETEEISVEAFENSSIAQELSNARAVTTAVVVSVGEGSTEGFTAFAMPDRLVLMESDEHMHRLGTVSADSMDAIVEELAVSAMGESQR